MIKISNTKKAWAMPEGEAGKIASDIRASLRNSMERTQYNHNDPAAIRQRIYEYFEDCAEQGKPPRVEGLTNALDVSRMTLLTWQKEGGERGELIRKAKGTIADLLEMWSMDGSIPSIHWMFTAKTAFGYIEQNRVIHEIEHTEGDGRIMGLPSREEIIKNIPCIEPMERENGLDELIEEVMK